MPLRHFFNKIFILKNSLYLPPGWLKLSYFWKFLLRTNFEETIMEFLDYSISGTISDLIFRFKYNICISKHCSEDIGLQKWVFNSQFPTFWSLSHFQHSMNSQISDKHSILCFCEQYHEHCTYNSDPTFKYDIFLLIATWKLWFLQNLANFWTFW